MIWAALIGAVAAVVVVGLVGLAVLLASPPGRHHGSRP